MNSDGPGIWFGTAVVVITFPGAVLIWTIWGRDTAILVSSIGWLMMLVPALLGLVQGLLFEKADARTKGQGLVFLAIGVAAVWALASLVVRSIR